VPHNDVSVNDGPHIRRWFHKIIILKYYIIILKYYIIILKSYIIILKYNIIIFTVVLQLPTVFSTVTCCTCL